MVQLETVEDQLKAIGCTNRFFGRPEIRELAKVLMPGEKISYLTNGFYEGGFATLTVTDQRLLLIDKKPMYLTIEDVRFDMIAEIDFNYRLLNATARVFSTNKTLVFTSWNHDRLRKLVEYLQHRVMQIRIQHMHMPNHSPSTMQAQFTPVEPQAQLPAPQPQQQQQSSNDDSSYASSTELSNDRRYAPSQAPHIVPSLAYLAMQGGGEAAEATATLPATPASETVNPYATAKLFSRRRKYPSYYQ